MKHHAFTDDESPQSPADSAIVAFVILADELRKLKIDSQEPYVIAEELACGLSIKKSFSEAAKFFNGLASISAEFGGASDCVTKYFGKRAATFEAFGTGNIDKLPKTDLIELEAILKKKIENDPQDAEEWRKDEKHVREALGGKPIARKYGSSPQLQ